MWNTNNEGKMFTGKVEKENDGLVTKKPIVLFT